jgi:hypothetical protein
MGPIIRTRYGTMRPHGLFGGADGSIPPHGIRRRGGRRLTRDHAVAAALGVVTFAIFFASPVRHASDARYTLLVSEQLLRRGTLRLDDYFSPAMAGEPGKATYNLERSGQHVYFRPAPGGAILSVPFVPMLRLLGMSAVDGQGRYDPAGDLRAQAMIAALLMAALTVFFYATARLLLPMGWSVAVALSGSLGTQVWSVASRALWSHTWEIALIGCVVWLLARFEVRGRRVSPVWLAALLAAAFLTRATAAGHAVAVTAYVVLFHREMLPRLLLTGVALLMGFVSSSLVIYGRPMPLSYYVWQRAAPGWMPLAAALVSPSRGLLVCVPLVLLVSGLLARYRRDVPSRPLLVLGMLGILLQVLPAGAIRIWWAGQSYGPRLTTGAVPWLVLLGVLAVRARLDATARTGAGVRTRPTSVLPLAGMAALSVFIHARGALSESTQRWNLRPMDIDASPGRVWDWRYPQWLAGLAPHPGRWVFPVVAVGEPLRLGPAPANVYLREGWGVADEDVRWSEERTARIQFTSSASGPLVLRMRMCPGPAWEESVGLPLTLELNGRTLAAWTVPRGLAVYSVPLPSVEGRQVLELKTPDMPARVPRGDPRPLRVGVEWLRLDRFSPLRPGVSVPVGERAADVYVGAGWGHPEGTYRWTVAPRASLHFAPEGLTAGVLRMRLHPFPASARGTGQRVYVSVNGQIAGTLALRDTAAVVHAVPLAAGLRGADTIVLETPDAKPLAGGNSDIRQLGVAVHWFKLDPFPSLVPGTAMNLAAPLADTFLGDGWGEADGGARPATALTADVLFAADPSTSKRVALTMEPHPMVAGTQRVRMALNGQPLGTVTLAQRGRRTYELDLPNGALGRQNVLRLAFPDARVPPPDAGGSHRALAVRVNSLELRP